MRRCQSVRGSVCYMGGRRNRRRQTGGMFMGAVIKKLFGGKRLQIQRGYLQRLGIVQTKSYTS